MLNATGLEGGWDFSLTFSFLPPGPGHARTAVAVGCEGGVIVFVTSVQALQEAVATHQPGDRVSLKVRRDDGDHSLSVTLGEQTG